MRGREGGREGGGGGGNMCTRSSTCTSIVQYIVTCSCTQNSSPSLFPPIPPQVLTRGATLAAIPVVNAMLPSPPNLVAMETVRQEPEVSPPVRGAVTLEEQALSRRT